LYNIHKKNPPVIDNEPKYGDIRQFTNFKVEALYARVSILEFLGIIQKGPSSFAEPGQETSDLGIMEDATGSHGAHIVEESCGKYPTLAPMRYLTIFQLQQIYQNGQSSQLTALRFHPTC
jgi:hypothetical protein